ncbi:DUF5366 family protein [Peribacillus kribbensis]|uniref:DUF5366 family protein n=1 Tax=Peribacillus kribbensis TaxID=356658 RepID=UPI0004224B66|nr:DUF5366 family protein [Peribacillus kribbensis]
MKNTYLAGYFPFISVILFSLSFAVFVEKTSLNWLQAAGIYDGMKEVFSEAGMKLVLLLAFFLVFFMLFAALKLIADTILGISLLFFSKNHKLDVREYLRLCSVIYFVGGILSILCSSWMAGIFFSFLGAVISAFIYFIYKISPALTLAGLVGIIFFHTLIWSSLLSVTAFSILKLYNSILASLPI